MNNLKLPNVEPEPEVQQETANNEVAPPPQIEVVVNQEEDIVAHQEIFKDATNDIPPPAPKKKRKPTQAQLDNLAKMREKRAENRAKAKADKQGKVAKIPSNATPIPRSLPSIQEAPPMPSMNSVDGFVNFMDYMEKYKTLKDNWKKREIEKAKRYVAKQEPKPVAEKKPETKTVKKKPVKKPTLLTNHTSNSNSYSDYF